MVACKGPALARAGSGSRLHRAGSGPSQSKDKFNRRDVQTTSDQCQKAGCVSLVRDHYCQHEKDGEAC